MLRFVLVAFIAAAAFPFFSFFFQFCIFSILPSIRSLLTLCCFNLYPLLSLIVQLPEFMWVDDTAHMESAMKKAFPSVQKVLEDATHGMRRYARTFPDGHVGIRAFMRDLSKAFFQVVPSDQEQLKQELMEAGRWGAAGTPTRAAAEKVLRSRCRHTIPPPKELRERVEKVAADHSNVVDPITGRILFTSDSLEVHKSMLFLIDAGKFSDPLPAQEMFLRLNSGKKDKFIGLRGTSKLEGFHCHLAKVLQGNRCSPELAGAMMADFIHGWNIDRAITNKQGTVNYGCYDTMLLEEINAKCQKLKLPLQFPNLKPTPKLQNIPPMFTLAVPPELMPVLCPPEGGVPPLNGASVEDDDACGAIAEFENEMPSLLLSTKNSDGANATAAPAPAVTAVAMDTHDSQTVEMLGTVAQPLPSQLLQQQQEEEEQQRPVLRGIVLQTLHQEELLEVMVTSPAAADASNAPPGARPPSRQGKRGRGRPPKSGTPPKKRKKDLLLPAASPLSPSSFSASPAAAVRRSPRARRNAMPVDYAHSVKTVEEAKLMIEAIGGDVASPQLRSSKKQKQIAEQYNITLQQRLLEDPQATAGMSYKQGRHVKQFVQRSTESLAAAATNQQVLLNQQQGPAPMEIPVEALQQSSNLFCGMDVGMLAPQQAAIPVSQQLQAMQQQQQTWWLPPLQQPALPLPPQPAPGPYYNAPMHPVQPPSYPGYGMYPNLDPVALVQAAAALLQAQQHAQPPAAGGKGSGKGAPGKPRNCGKCFKPLKGKDKEEGACFCKSNAVQEPE